MKLKSIVLMVSFFSVILISCGKKKEPDFSKYAESCAKVVQCDAQFKALPDAQNSCQKFLGTLNEKLPAVVPQIEECIKSTACEELTLQQCGAKHVNAAQGLMGQ